METYERLVNEIKTCKKCKLWKERRNAVPGEGSLDVDIMLVGEAPGRQEDIQGKPFVGRAGELLTEFLGDIGLKREDTYITNVLKCRPPGNRDPKQEEIDICLPYLKKQIRMITPKIMITLGRFATRSILGLKNITVRRISKVRGKTFDVWGITILPTYHPAAALYNPSLKEDIIQDFKKVRSLMSGEALKSQDRLDDFLSG